MYRAVLIWSLLACLALPTSALQGKGAPDPEAEIQALIQRLVLDRAATIAALQRAADERERRMLSELEAKDRRLRSEIGKRKSAQAELLRVTAERQRLVDDIATRDRQLAAEIAEYRKQVASIANSPDPRKRAALARYAEGDRAGAFDALVEIQVEMEKAADKAVAAGWREIATLALDRKDRGEMTTADVIPFYEQAHKRDPDHLRSWIELSQLYQEAGRLPDATHAAQQALDCAQEDGDRAVAENEFGYVLLRAGDLQAAKDHFEKGLAIHRRLVQADPTSAEAKRNLSNSLEGLGDVLAADRDLQGAKARFTENLAIRRELAKASPTNAALQRDLSVGLDKLGDVLGASGELQAAKPYFEDSLAINQRLAQANPTSSEAQRDLSRSLDRLALLLVTTGDLQAAKAHLEENLAKRKQMAQRDPTNAEAQRDLITSHVLLGALPGGESHWREALKIALELQHNGRLAPADAWMVDDLRQRVSAADEKEP